MRVTNRLPRSLLCMKDETKGGDFYAETSFGAGDGAGDAHGCSRSGHGANENPQSNAFDLI